MKIQNISINFNTEDVNVLYENQHYSILNVITDIKDIEQEFKDTYNVIFDFVVIQLTEDQHISEPRILCSYNENITIINMIKIVEDHPELFEKLHNVRLKIEEYLTSLEV